MPVARIKKRAPVPKKKTGGSGPIKPKPRPGARKRVAKVAKKRGVPKRKVAAKMRGRKPGRY